MEDPFEHVEVVCPRRPPALDRVRRIVLVRLPSFYDTASGADPTLQTVLNTPGANTFGAASGPLGLNAFNATGGFLTNALPGYAFSLDAKNGEENELTCPIDNHGNWKKGTIFNP